MIQESMIDLWLQGEAVHIDYKLIICQVELNIQTMVRVGSLDSAAAHVRHKGLEAVLTWDLCPK